MQKVKVWYDPNSVDNVWIRDGAAFIRLEIVDYLKEKYSGFRLEEVEDRIAVLSQISPDKEYDRLNKAARTRDANEEIDNQAKAMKQAAPKPASKAAAKSNKTKNRRAEVEVERATDSAELSLIQSSDPIAPNNLPAPEPVTSEPSARKKVILKLVSSKLMRTEQ